MTWNRREFVKMGGALTVYQSVRPGQGFATELADAGKVPSEAERITYTPATAYRPYISRTARRAEASTWVQIDLGSSKTIDNIRLYPAFNLGGKHASGFGFPVRFKIESSTDASFANAKTIVDSTGADLSNPDDRIAEYKIDGVLGRYVRVSATKLRAAADGIGYNFALSKIDILSHGKNIAEHAPVTGDKTFASPKDLAQLTRSERPMGEGIITDNPDNVTPANQWKSVPYRATAPLGGVTLESGVFKTSMENNIGYLLSSFSVDEMLTPFRERAGKKATVGLRKPIGSWDTGLPGSSAGRFLMGAGNTLRWIEHDELRSWLDSLVNGIEECRQPNGYIMAYPEDSIMDSERGAYTRAWLTHGLIEAGYAGNKKAFPLLRGYYDWFNQCSYLPKLLRGATQGVQGMVANTRVYFTPVGLPADIQVVQRYYQENYWLAGLAQRSPEIVWQYPYDRPHNYLITNFEAYLDIYRATGDKRYLDAMEGAWDLYHDNWEHVGGSIAITEFGEFPPKSYRLIAQQPFCETGETCGSAFWARFNQRFHLLHPEEEKYVSEIEKSIYNVGLANQVETHGIIYHARLVGQKGDLQVTLCQNSCCEGQGTRLLGTIPEYIYSVAPNGIYVNLFAPSSVGWKQSGTDIKLVQSTNFPLSPEVSLHLRLRDSIRSKIAVRVPAWAAKEMPILLNGNAIASGMPGTYVTLDRTWFDGDTISFTLPIELKLTRYTGLDQIEGHERYALEYGPVLLALTGSSSAVLKVTNGREHTDIVNQVRADTDRPLHFTIDGHPEYKYIPYWKVLSEPFTCFPVVDV